MTAADAALTGLAVLAWFIGSLIVGAVLGRVVERRDRQVPKGGPDAKA